jgi:hypothetical protein
MRGRDLIAQCAENDRVELASGAGKVHWVWMDKSGPRICRPSMLDSTRPGEVSEWKRFEGSEAEFRLRRCGECDLQTGMRGRDD